MNLGNRVAKVITSGTGIIESYLQRNLNTFVQALQSPVSEVITDMCYLKKYIYIVEKCIFLDLERSKTLPELNKIQINGKESKKKT